MKCCTKCNHEKPLDAFSVQPKGKFCVTSICKLCTSERGKNWHQANRERSLASKNAYRIANSEKAKARAKAWREANFERAKASAAVWTAENMEKKAAATARRRAAQMRAVPSWARMDDIKKFYVLAHSMTKQYGIKATVDHLVPLQSPLVCGLHCAANLSIETEKLNKRKGNLWWPHMWGRDEDLDA